MHVSMHTRMCKSHVLPTTETPAGNTCLGNSPLSEQPKGLALPSLAGVGQPLGTIEWCVSV